MENITVAWDGARGFELLGTTHEKLIPKELLLLALGQCAAMTALALFEKMKVRVTAFQIETSGELSGPPGVAYTVFTAFAQRFRMDCPDPADHAKALHALRLTHDKYCGVGRMLALVAPVTYSVSINENDVPVE